MQRLKQYINRRITLTYTCKTHDHQIGGVITTVGKSYILFIPNEGDEMPIKRNRIKNITP